jgi:hypothetical protein
MRRLKVNQKSARKREGYPIKDSQVAIIAFEPIVQIVQSKEWLIRFNETTVLKTVSLKEYLNKNA